MTTELQPGTVLREKYRVERVLGKGGMGVVLEARHVELDRRVAIKVLHAELRAHAELVERFLREGRAASKIEGEHVARVLDVDRLPDGTPFIVMEYLEGHDLSSVRRARQPLPVAEAVSYVLQACEAIAQAHRAGIIHRDLKPANLFLTELHDGTSKIKVLDFGISKTLGPLDGSEPSMTRTTLVMGSVEYMSPEQMLSTRDVDLRTDIWALGAVLFELVTAQVPFPGETMTQVCALVMSRPAPSPRTLRPDLPERLEQVILRCLDKVRERRFASIAELASALEACLPGPAASLLPVTSWEPDGAWRQESGSPPPPHRTAAPPDGAALPRPPAAPDRPVSAPAPLTAAVASPPGIRPFETDAAVWRERASLPPRRRMAPLLLGALGLAALVGLGAVGLVALAEREPTAASSGPASSSLEPASTASAPATHDALPSADAPGASDAASAPEAAPLPRVTAPEPSASAAQSASAPSAAQSVSATTAAGTPTAPAPTTPPAPPPRPPAKTATTQTAPPPIVKTSGID
ncbi:MAG: protein kinase [Myxococcales bacterium]|nr:protein kinase [Myxococcales bacterium]